MLNSVRWSDTKQMTNHVSSRIDRDVINALIAGHFGNFFFRTSECTRPAGLEVRALPPDATDVWVIEPKTGRKSAKRMSRLRFFSAAF